VGFTGEMGFTARSVQGIYSAELNGFTRNKRFELPEPPTGNHGELYGRGRTPELVPSMAEHKTPFPAFEIFRQ